MRVIDPGHQYALSHLDGNLEELLTFVKREGAGYPGNHGSHPGTNLQEVLRAMIDRVLYLERQKHDGRNEAVISAFRTALLLLEERAAERHNRKLRDVFFGQIEMCKACGTCGHIQCQGHAIKKQGGGK